MLNYTKGKEKIYAIYQLVLWIYGVSFWIIGVVQIKCGNMCGA